MIVLIVAQPLHMIDHGPDELKNDVDKKTSVVRQVNENTFMLKSDEVVPSLNTLDYSRSSCPR